MVVALAAAMLVACGGRAEVTSTSHDAGAETGGPPPAGQHILFEVSYENYAWQASLSGVFITADGSVYRYDYFSGRSDASAPTINYPATEQQLRTRYGTNPKKIASLPLSQLRAHFAEVAGAADGVLLQQSNCADAGEVTFMGYRFDSATARYSPVILGVNGDQAARNLAPEAASLVAWLSSYLPNSAMCQFNSFNCTGATCSTPAPSCPSLERPSVVNGCWSSCVSADRCVSVSGCSECGAGDVCVTGQDGTTHCLRSNCQSADPCSCAVMPPCAGGSAYCTNLGPLHVRCGH